MGCGNSRSNYTMQYCSLDPILGEANKYLIYLIGEEILEKKENEKLLKQIGKNNDPKVTAFFERPSLEKRTILYFYLREQPLLKSYNQSLKILPYNLPSLKKVVMLSLDNASEYPNEIIENETKELTQDEIIGKVLNLQNIKEKLDKLNNPNITKDSLSLKEDSENYEEGPIKEKKGELIITEEVNKATFNDVIKKCTKNKRNNSPNINVNLETSIDNNKEDKNSSYIKAVKIFSATFGDIDIFDNIMNYLEDKDIKKFSFFDNNINNDFEGWDAITQFLENNYAIRYLDLHSSSLYDYHLTNISRALSDKRLRYLDISENFITLEGVDIIANLLSHNKTLQKLNISRNAQSQFKSEGVQLITEALMNSPNIEFIDFSFMNLTGCGEYIGNFITNNKSIKTIYIRSVKLNANDFKNIFVPLKTNKNLKELDISLNDMGGDKSLQYIADAIVENKTLNNLKLDQMNINNDNYRIIFDAIEKNKTITHYSVNYNSKINPKIMLNFFIKQKQVKYLEYEPFDKENAEDRKKELTLEERKLFDKFKKERPDMKVINK